MLFLGIILLVALLIPIVGIVIDSPIGKALARRLEGPEPTPIGVAGLARGRQLPVRRRYARRARVSKIRLVVRRDP